MTNDDTIPPAAAAREHSKGQVSQNPEEREHGPLVGKSRVRKLLTKMKEHYDPQIAVETIEGDHKISEMPPTVEETKLWNEIMHQEATETAARAVYQGREETLSYISGAPQFSKDISGLSAIEELRDIMGRQAPLVYIFGPPGAGKTNFALLLAQLYKRKHETAVLGSNIRSWEQSDKWIPNYSTLDKWLSEAVIEQQNGEKRRDDEARNRLFVFDEASSHASGRGKQGYEAGQKLAPMTYQIRKSNAAMIIVGHDGRDVHPAVRELATVVQRFRGELKRAILWQDVRNRQGEGKIAEITGIPETDYDYNDGEASYWEFDSDDSEEERQEDIEAAARNMQMDTLRPLAARLVEADNDMTQAEIGEALGLAHKDEAFTQAWVAKQKRKHGE